MGAIRRPARPARLLRPALAAAALLAFGPPAPGAEPVDVRALDPRSTYVLDLPFLHFEGLTGEPPSPGAVRWSAEGTYGNTFSHSWHAQKLKEELGTVGRPFTREEAEILHQRTPQDAILFVDAEVLRAAATAEVGLGRETSISLEIPYLSFSTVSGDNALVAFHRAFGIQQAQRTDFPAGGYLVVLQAPGGPLVYEDRRPSDGIGDVVATGKWRHPLARGLSLSLDLALKLPTGSARDFRGSGSVDAGAMAELTATAGRQSWFVEAGGVVPGRWRGPLPYDASPFGRVLLGTGRTLGARRLTKGTLCVVYEESPLRGAHLRFVSQPAVHVTLGLRRAFGDRAEASLLLDEHLPRFGDGTDVAVRLAIRLGK